MTKFDQATYWIGRHKRLKDDPRSVGNLCATVEENLQGESRLKSIVANAAHLLADTRPRSVLDIGCGYGRIASSWVGAGFAYTGIDVSPDAITTAEQRQPNSRFICADVRSWAAEQDYGAVCALYVMVHFVDDNDWRETLRAALCTVSPCGYFVLADHFSATRQTPAPHVVNRPIAAYVPILTKAGFALDEALRERFLAATANNPLAGHFLFARRRG